jgi:hypothetical protein
VRSGVEAGSSLALSVNVLFVWPGTNVIISETIRGKNGKMAILISISAIFAKQKS